MFEQFLNLFRKTKTKTYEFAPGVYSSDMMSVKFYDHIFTVAKTEEQAMAEAYEIMCFKKSTYPNPEKVLLFLESVE